MRTSASAFAAQLADDLCASAPTCTVGARSDMSELCGRPGGPAQATCLFGHVESYTSCPECATHRLYCLECFGDVDVPVTITTEVAA